MAEAFMKVLPQVEIAIEEKMLQNPYSKQDLRSTLNQETIKRIKQIWNFGIYVIIERDPKQSEFVIQRKVIYNPQD